MAEQVTQAGKGPSAANTVFAIPELLEQILDHLARSSLFKLVRTSRAFRNTIHGSRVLKRRMNLLHNSTYSFDDLVENTRPYRDYGGQFISIQHWHELPGEMAPLRYVLGGYPETRTSYRPFKFSMVQIDRIAMNASVVFELDIPDWKLKQPSKIGVEGKKWLYGYAGNQEASWTGMVLFTMAMPVSLVVNATLGASYPMAMEEEVRADRRIDERGNVVQRLTVELEASEATVGRLCSFLEETLFAARYARWEAYR